MAGCNRFRLFTVGLCGFELAGCCDTSTTGSNQAL